MCEGETHQEQTCNDRECACEYGDADIIEKVFVTYNLAQIRHILLFVECNVFEDEL